MRPRSNSAPRPRPKARPPVKPDVLVLKRLDELEKLTIKQHRDVTEQLDDIERSIKKDKLRITPELEEQIKRATALTHSIDQKVEDL